MPISQSIGKLLTSNAMKGTLKEFQTIAEHELQQAIWKYVYQAYTPIPEEDGGYRRTYELLNAITSTDLVVTPTSIEFKVILDPEKMNHYSVIDGEETFVPPLIDEGFKWKNWSGGVDMFHERPSEPFLQAAVEEIQKDLNARVQLAIVKALRNKKMR